MTVPQNICYSQKCSYRLNKLLKNNGGFNTLKKIFGRKGNFYLVLVPESMSPLRGQSKVGMALLHVRSKVVIAPLHVRGFHLQGWYTLHNISCTIAYYLS